MDFKAFQEVINKIEGVISSKLIYDNDNLTELHVLANKLRAPKQIVRDIESSLLAMYDYRIDRKIISIAQIETDEQECLRRIKFNAINYNIDENIAECCVKLEYAGEEYESSISGIKTASNRRKFIAEATVKSVEKILGQPSIFDIQEVSIHISGNISYVTVIVNIVYKLKEEIMIGSSIVKNDVNEAIARATLDAVNRRIQEINI